jgi:hypothetical protein
MRHTPEIGATNGFGLKQELSVAGSESSLLESQHLGGDSEFSELCPLIRVEHNFIKCWSL